MPASNPGPRPVGLPAHLAWPVPVDPGGRSGPRRFRDSRRDWRRSSHGLYVPAHAPLTVDQRIVEAAAVLPAYGGLTGWAALRWLGARWFAGTGPGGREERPVILAIGDRSIRPQPGIGTSEERLSPDDLAVWAGLRITHAVRSAFFEMRYVGTDELAVQVADMAAYDDLVSPAELIAYGDQHPGWTGVGRFRRGVLDMEENAWSPTEVTMRGVWTREAGLPRPLCNRPVFDLNGHHLGTPDLIDPVAGVVGEYNGADHFDRARRWHDVQREALFRGAGLEPVEMLSGDLGNPFAFVARLRAAYVRAARLPASERKWTIELPPWWTPTFTVDQRRALDEDQRRRLLAYRRTA